MTGVLPEFVSFAHELAEQAGDVIRPLFRVKMAIDAKGDQSPVTIADRNAEQAMRGLIMKRYPGHGILGEEFEAHQPDAKYVWVLDPVDGTLSFISGLPTFGILISLTRLGVPVLGLIDQPINHERWLGVTGSGTTFNGTPARTRNCPELKLATLSTTSPRLFSPLDRQKYEHVEKTSRYTVYGYDCYAYAQLASGFIDAVIETGLKPHDFCALRPVVEGAGGIMTDWEGKPLTMASDGRVVAAGDARVHQQVLDMLKS